MKLAILAERETKHVVNTLNVGDSMHLRLAILS